MKLKQLFPLLTIAICFCSCKKENNPVTPVDEQVQISADVKAMVNELNSCISPCSSSLPDADDSDLKVLDDFADAKVIGVGEATHGTKEFFQMKHRLFKYFVEHHGFKIFGFEADMAECIYIDRFITSNEGSLNDVMQKMHFWTWKTEEVANLILWMKQYNEGKAPGNKIHLLGVDCQNTDMNGPLISEYFQRYDPTHPAFIDTLIIDIENLNIAVVANYTTVQSNMFKSQCYSVIKYFDENQSRLSAASGEFEFQNIRQLLRQTQQFIDVYTVKTFNYRDKYMAENTIWLTTLLGGSTKVMQWAHNGHVGKIPASYGGSQGYNLQVQLAEEYMVIGFSFDEGSFRAVGYNGIGYTGLGYHYIDQLPLEGSSNLVFYFADPPNFILKMGDARKSNSLNNWINSPHKFLMIGAVYDDDGYAGYFFDQNLGSTFDAIINFHTTTASAGFIHK